MTRLLRARIRSVFHIDGRLWPAFLSRGDEGRQKDSEALNVRLSSHARRGNFDGDALDRLAALLVAAEAEPARRSARRCSRPSAAPSIRHSRRRRRPMRRPTSWRTGRRRSRFKALWLRLSGACSARARDVILEAAKDDPYCAHAISLALPNMIASFERMRALRRVTPNPVADALHFVTAALVLRGPKHADPRRQAARASRRSAARAPPPEREDRRRRDARSRSAAARSIRFDRGKAQILDRRLVFNEGSWAACPAREWVPELFAEIWRRSAGQHGASDERRPDPPADPFQERPARQEPHLPLLDLRPVRQRGRLRQRRPASTGRRASPRAASARSSPPTCR